MNYADTFHADCIRADAKVKTKAEAISLIAGLAADSGRCTGYDAAKIQKALSDREEAGSTGFEDGIALPHCALPGLTEFVSGVVTVPGGVDFDSLDKKPTTLIFFVIGPENRRNDHIHLISAISRSATDMHFRNAIIQATGSEEILGIIKRAISVPDVAQSEARSLVHVFVQREELFNELLSICTAAAPGSICVVDASNAGAYVDRLPLFSAFWIDREDRFFRIIMATVNQRLQNDLLRRIHTAVQHLEEEPGVLVTVQPVTYFAGSLEL